MYAAVRSMPMPPRHLIAVSGRQRPSTAPSPVSPPPAGLTATRPRQTFEGHRQLRQSIGSGVLHESDCEDDHAPRLGQPSPDGSLEARERQVLLVCFPHHLLSRVPGHLTRLTQWQLRRTVGPGLQDAEVLLIAVQQFAVRESTTIIAF